MRYLVGGFLISLGPVAVGEHRRGWERELRIAPDPPGCSCPPSRRPAQSPKRLRDPLSGSIRTMGHVSVVAVIWTSRCASSARYGAQAPADRRTDASTMPAARDRADYSASAGADQTAAQCSIRGIVRVRDGCGRQHQSRADHAGYGRLLCHLLSTEKLWNGAGLFISSRSRPSSNSPCNGINKWHGVAVPVSRNANWVLWTRGGDGALCRQSDA